MKKGKKVSKANARQYFFELDVLDQALLQLNASEIISQAFLEMESAKHFELYPSIVGRQKIGELGFGGSILQEQTCNWNDSEVILDGQEVEACPMSVMIEICQWDIERSFIAANQPMNKPMDAIVPADFQAVINKRVTEKLGEELEYITWQGDTDLDMEVYGSLALCDGLEKKAHEYFIAGDIVPAQIVTNVGEVTESNVIEVLKDAFKKIPVNLRKKKAMLKWFVSQNIADSYLIATANQSNEVYFLTDRPLNFLGIEMVEAGGASDNVQFISRKVNFAKLTDMLTETPSFNVVNMKSTTNEPKWRLRADLKYGVDMLNQNEFVIMLPILTPVIDSLTPTSGNVASSVEIAGNSFTGATKVLFGTTEAVFTVDDDETITATVPTLADGAVNVTVVTNAGTSNAISFTVTS